MPLLNADTLTNTRTSQGTDLFSLSQNKLGWLQDRQQVLARNIANSDTPGYISHDLTPFQSALNQFDVTPTLTNAQHIATTSNPNGSAIQIVAEQSPDGNQVSLDQEMEKVADTNDQQHLVVNLYSKYMTMFQTALGK